MCFNEFLIPFLFAKHRQPLLSGNPANLISILSINHRLIAPMRRLSLLASLLLTLVWFLSAPVTLAKSDVADLQVSQKQLKTLKDKMQKLQGRLNSAQGEKGKLQAELGKTEVKISNLLKEIARLEDSLKASQSRLDALGVRERDLQNQLAQQKNFLARQIRAAYSQGDNHALKMLLSLESLEQADRMMSYHQYFNRARSERIDRYLVLLRELDQTRQAMVSENEALRKDREALGQQRTELESSRRKQAATLAKINQDIKTDESELKRLQQDQKRLEQLIQEVERAIADIPTPDSGKHSFAEMRAKLSWPVRGKLLRQFSTQPDRDGIKWNGILIGAAAGTPVKAVHPGRVVFSDWLRGFGLLVIIDHGKGYMSLYGSNQAVYKQPGDWVAGGETIASTGTSGGQSDSGLYFEVRHKGVPKNPLHWLVNQGG